VRQDADVQLLSVLLSERVWNHELPAVAGSAKRDDMRARNHYASDALKQPGRRGRPRKRIKTKKEDFCA
jgi:hypothetical protein